MSRKKKILLSVEFYGVAGKNKYFVMRQVKILVSALEANICVVKEKLLNFTKFQLPNVQSGGGKIVF